MSLLTIGAYYDGVGVPTAVPGQVGDTYKDTSVVGNLYTCTVAGSPGTWELIGSAGLNPNYNYRNSVDFATNITLNATYNNGASGVGATLTATTNTTLVVDSMFPAVGNRILVKDISPPTSNGIYVVTNTGAAGGGGHPWILTRTSDYDGSLPSSVPLYGDVIYVLTGTVNANQSFYQYSSTSPFVFGADNLAYFPLNSQFNWSYRNPVRAVATTNLVSTYTAANPPLSLGELEATSNTTLTIDGQLIFGGDRVLLTAQTAGVQNGIWVCTNPGGATPWILERVADYSGATNAQALQGDLIFVNQGTIYSGTWWQLQTVAPIIGTSILVYTQALNVNLVRSNVADNNLYGGDNGPALITSGSFNTTYGESAGASINNSTAQYNTLIGTGAGEAITNQNRITALGNDAAGSMTGSNNIAIGPSAGTLISSSNNIAIGTVALRVCTAAGNIAIGNNAGQVSANPSATSNLFIGYNTGSVFTGAGANNTFVGTLSADLQTNYTGCTFIGTSSDATVNSLSNATAIGYATQVSVSNSVNLGLNANVGINNPSPAYNLDIALIGTQATIALSPTTVSPAATKNSIYVNATNDFYYQDINGRQVNLSTPNSLQIASIYGAAYTSLQSGPGVTILPLSTKAIYIKNFYIQILTAFVTAADLYLYISSAGNAVVIPNAQLLTANTVINAANNATATIDPTYFNASLIGHNIIVIGSGPAMTAGSLNAWIEYTYV